jgi:hypothetical protein
MMMMMMMMMMTMMMMYSFARCVHEPVAQIHGRLNQADREGGNML